MAVSPAVEPQMEETIISMGPQHPSTHGVLRLVLTLEGEVITKADPDIGYLHRGFEKFCENRTYAQIVPYCDRLDYVAAFSMALTHALASEKLAGLEPPPRASYLRVIFAELQRIASHLVWLGCQGLDLGAWTLFLYCFRERELIVDLFESYCGARLTYHAVRIGGMPFDLPEGWVEQARAFLKVMPERLKEYDALFTGNRIFVARMKGVGMLPREQAINIGCSGPVLRGSGVALDRRKSEPHCVYDQMDFKIAVEQGCDSLARYLVRMEEMRQSLRIIEQALDQLPEGPVMAKVPRVFKPPAGEAFVRTEAPRGDFGVYLVSDGSTKPARVRFHSPCFRNVAALPYLLKGWKVADVVAILGTLDIVLGEIDR